MTETEILVLEIELVRDLSVLEVESGDLEITMDSSPQTLEIEVLSEVELEVAVSQGPPGPPGPPGASGSYYDHEQVSASTTWIIVHNLGKNPAYTVIESSGDVLIGVPSFDSLNQLTLTFSAPVSGHAYLN